MAKIVCILNIKCKEWIAWKTGTLKISTLKKMKA